MIDCLVQTLGRKTTCAQVKVAVIKTICTLLHAPDGELAGRRDNGGTDIGESGGAGGGDGGGGESVATQGELLRMVWRSSGLQVLSGLLAHALVSAGTSPKRCSADSLCCLCSLAARHAPSANPLTQPFATPDGRARRGGGALHRAQDRLLGAHLASVPAAGRLPCLPSPCAQN